MGIDWEEILDAEGEDMADAYNDSLPEEEPVWYENPEEEADFMDSDKKNEEKTLKKKENIEILDFSDDELDEEDLEIFDWK